MCTLPASRFAFLRLDKLSRRRRTKGEAPASPFALKLKAIRSEFHAGNGAAVVTESARACKQLLFQ